MLDAGVPEASGNPLYIDALICKQGGMAVPEIVNSDMRKLRFVCVMHIVNLDSGIRQARVPATDAKIFAVADDLHLAILLLTQNVNQRSRHLQRAIG